MDSDCVSAMTLLLISYACTLASHPCAAFITAMAFRVSVKSISYECYHSSAETGGHYD